MYDDMWESLAVEDLWIYDKLILSKKLGYVCGPVGIKVPLPDRYVVRPVTNIMGMGQGAEIAYIIEDTDLFPIGHFWCEVFEGRHLSVDYYQGNQVLCVEGTRELDVPLYKWSKWSKVDDVIPYPSILGKVFPHVNCEFIGGKLIEVHLRHNPDWIHQHDVIYPVWYGEDTTPPEGMKFVADPDFYRVGFFIPIT